MITRSPTVVGMPLYGDAAHASEALEALLAQSCEPALIVVVDDGGGARDHLDGLLAHSRVRYIRNDERLGLVENWRRTFRQARELHPGAEYFAWASDHDVCHPRWLEFLSDALTREPEAVLAVPDFAILDSARRVRVKRRRFDTSGERSPTRRLTSAYWGMAPGYAVYGLYRAAALERAGVFPAVLFPDRLLLAELSVLGPFVRVAEVLWYRRKIGRFSLQRQRRSLFGAQVPAHAWLPWWLVHIVVFARAAVGGGLCSSHRAGVRAGIVHARVCTAWAARRFKRRIRRRVKALPAALAHWTLRAVRRAFRRVTTR